MRRRRLYFPALAILLVVIVLLFFTDLFGFEIVPGFPRIRFQRTITFSTSSVTLRDVHELYALTTLEYVHRYVFPYDFMPEGITIQDVTRRLRNNEGPIEEILTPEEYLFYRTYNLASDIGLARGDSFQFVVVTLVLTAGFDVRDQPDDATDAVSWEEYMDAAGEIRRRAVVTLPEARILNRSIEDIVPDEYAYPDLALGADDWRQVTDYVREHPLDADTLARILGTAEENGREFLYSLLRSAGFDDVVFGGEHQIESDETNRSG